MASEVEAEVNRRMLEVAKEQGITYHRKARCSHAREWR